MATSKRRRRPQARSTRQPPEDTDEEGEVSRPPFLVFDPHYREAFVLGGHPPEHEYAERYRGEPARASSGG